MTEGSSSTPLQMPQVPPIPLKTLPVCSLQERIVIARYKAEQLQQDEIDFDYPPPDESNIDLVEARLERITWEITHRRYIKRIFDMMDYMLDCIGKQIKMPVTGAIAAENVQNLTQLYDKYYLQSDVSRQLTMLVGAAELSVAKKGTKDESADGLATAATSALDEVKIEFGCE